MSGLPTGPCPELRNLPNRKLLRRLAWLQPALDSSFILVLGDCPIKTQSDRVAVVVAAAGKSTRFGDPTVRKPFVLLAGRPVWKRSLDAISADPRVDQRIVVVSAEDRDWFETTYAADLVGVDVVNGGSTRAASVGAGIAVVASSDFVAVHDAARPLVSLDQVTAVYDVAIQAGAAILATPVASTVKRGAVGFIEETIPREDLWLAQTPQVARKVWFDEAYADPSGPAWQPADPTDEAQLLERCGHSVRLVESTARNFKITTQEDYVIAQALVSAGAES